MRKVIVSEFVSLDGIMEDPRWTFQFSGEEQPQFKFDELAAATLFFWGGSHMKASRWLGPA